ncbi:hypothetical protein ACQKII_14455 [Lysinibacillus sp. NPDC048646]|uniref:hypothetical protein n=1 Tax=Lysinibacillus sp. NPDC048646 TaxID=3390574 RepID=UPI003D072F90
MKNDLVALSIFCFAVCNKSTSTVKTNRPTSIIDTVRDRKKSSTGSRMSSHPLRIKKSY